MRSGASRRGLVLLALSTLVVLGGCSSLAKQRYLKHLTTTIAPVSPETATVAAATDGGSAVAVVNRNEATPR
ncbi:MAG: hypothetical protein ACYSU7_10880 [Planctomycetota bacterium]|jgi:hypothetical protein